MPSILTSIGGGIIVILLVLLFIFNGKLDKLQGTNNTLSAEKLVIELSNKSLIEKISVSNAKIKGLEVDLSKREAIFVKEVGEIQTIYKEKRILIRDLNESEECIAIRRIINEDINATISTSD